MKTTTLLILALLLTTAIWAAAPASSNLDAAAAFTRLKTLAGEWEGNSDQGKVRLSYEVISGGNSVVEHEFMANEPEMLTVYYLDGSRLLLTHYCSAGNQPRMEASSFEPQSGELRFQFLDATNLGSPKARHMHNVTLRLVDKDHLSADWQLFENGQQKLLVKTQYTRVR